jgi:hypothetical protein
MTAAPLPIDDPLGRFARRSPNIQALCSLRRLPPARQPARRWRSCPGSRANASFYSNRARSPPAPPRRAWPQRILAPLLYVNIGALPGSAFAIARR